MSGSQAKKIIRKHSAPSPPETVEPGPAEPAGVVADLGQAQKDVEDLVRELQRRSIPDSDIANILRRCAAVLEGTEDGPDATATEPKRPSLTAHRIKIRKPAVHAPAGECDSKPAEVKASRPAATSDAALVDGDGVAGACGGCQAAQCGCESTRYIPLRHGIHEYDVTMNGQIPMFRRRGAPSAGWTQAGDVFAERIRQAWQKHGKGQAGASTAA